MDTIKRSQSPLVGAFVPAERPLAVLAALQSVAIPSGRGIRSGDNEMTVMIEDELVAIPSGRGIRSGK